MWNFRYYILNEQSTNQHGNKMICLHFWLCFYFVFQLEMESIVHTNWHIPKEILCLTWDKIPGKIIVSVSDINLLVSILMLHEQEFNEVNKYALQSEICRFSTSLSILCPYELPPLYSKHRLNKFLCGSIYLWKLSRQPANIYTLFYL